MSSSSLKKKFFASSLSDGGGAAIRLRISDGSQMGRPLLEAFTWFVCHNEMTLFFLFFHFTVDWSTSIYLPFSIHKSKTNRCIQRKAGPVCQPSRPRQGRSGAGRRRSHSHLIAKVIEPILCTFRNVWATFRCLPFGHENQSIDLFLLRPNTNQKYIH